MKQSTHVQRQQLIRLGVPSLFIAVALDEGPGPPMRSPYTDLSKLYASVSILVRCCDVSILQKSLQQVMMVITTYTYGVHSAVVFPVASIVMS